MRQQRGWRWPVTRAMMRSSGIHMEVGRQMAFEELKAQIGMLLGEMNEQPEDLHELYEQIHQQLNELRATGMALPRDLLELEQRLLEEFPRASKA
jgi:hypothetical protein